LYCGGGFRSALVAENLQKMGYNQQLSQWTADGKAGSTPGLPIAKD